MGHKRLRDDEGDVGVRSDFPITCGSCLSPCVRKSWSENAMIRRARLGLSQESSFVRAREMPSQNINTHRSGSLDDPVANAAGPGSLVPPEDKSIKRLVLRGRKYLRIFEQDIREKFVAYGEIESITIRSLAEQGWACIAYKTRQGAEKATQELSEWLVVNGQRLKLAWVPSSSDLPVVCDTCLWERRLKMPEKEVARRPESGDRRIYIYQNETPSQERERRRQEILSSPAVAALLAKAGPLTLKPPKDKSVRTLLVYGLDERVLEQDVRDQFVAYGEIQCVTIRFTDEIGWAWAFVTFTTRQGAEKASQALSEGLVINGQRVQVTWGMRDVPEPDGFMIPTTAI